MQARLGVRTHNETQFDLFKLGHKPDYIDVEVENLMLKTSDRKKKDEENGSRDMMNERLQDRLKEIQAKKASKK